MTALKDYTKPYKKGLRRRYRTLRRRITERAPPWLQRRIDPAIDYFDLVLLDHGVFRYFYANRHKLAKDVWRSAQPAPHHINAYARRGIRTIVNLRGERDCGSYRLEAAACARHGITLIDFPVNSRIVPLPETLRAAKELFERVEYPMLMHCKSGADRVGLMSVLYLFFKENRPLEEAMRQLSLRFGHFKQADTGILDYFFERYLQETRQNPMPFMDWVEQISSRQEFKRSFKARSWANLLVNRLLRRE